MTSVLITGANRGLGLEFARQYAADGWRVFATCRDPEATAALAAVAGDVQLYRMDVTFGREVADTARQLAGEPIDLLLNNAGIIGPRSMGFGQIDYEAWAEVMAVNTLAPIRVAEAFADHVAASDWKRMAFITSSMGSIAGGGGGYTPYRSSKAALNAAVVSLTGDLAARGITAVVIHPGWVKTDMGGPGAALTPARSVAAMRRVFQRLTAADAGRFFNHDGATVPW
ncbi:MAG: SDR family oxidoreductase [Kiloniellales bacterium]